MIYYKKAPITTSNENIVLLPVKPLGSSYIDDYEKLNNHYFLQEEIKKQNQYKNPKELNDMVTTNEILTVEDKKFLLLYYQHTTYQQIEDWLDSIIQILTSYQFFNTVAIPLDMLDMGFNYIFFDSDRIVKTINHFLKSLQSLNLHVYFYYDDSSDFLFYNFFRTYIDNKLVLFKELSIDNIRYCFIDDIFYDTKQNTSLDEALDNYMNALNKKSINSHQYFLMANRYIIGLINEEDEKQYLLIECNQLEYKKIGVLYKYEFISPFYKDVNLAFKKYGYFLNEKEEIIYDK